MELCERYLHYMSALCEGTMPAPPELALTADTTEERAAQLQSALKDLSVPDFVRLCAKSAGDELDGKMFDNFNEEDFSRALPQMLTAAAELEQPEEKPPAAESTLIPTRASTRSRSSATAWSSTNSSLRTSSTF
ncbi:MAG: hypothetical protein ACLRSD_13120 [Oscillibacter sp.]